MSTWRDLDPATRKALLRGEPAGDPEIDRIGRAHAEQALARFNVRVAVITLPVSLVAGLLLGLFAVQVDLSAAAMVPVVVVGAIGCLVVMGRRRLALIRLLNVSHGTPRNPVTPGTSERLEVRTSAAGVLRMVAPYLCVVIAVFAAGLVISNLWLMGIAVVVAAPIVAYTGYLLVSSKHPLVLDGAGIHLPHYGARVGWESFREIRVVPLRATAKDTRHVIAFLLDNDHVYLRQLPSWQAFLARLNKKTYLSPLVLVDGLVDKPIDSVAAAAAGLSKLPVTTSPQGPRP